MARRALAAGADALWSRHRDRRSPAHRRGRRLRGNGLVPARPTGRRLGPGRHGGPAVRRLADLPRGAREHPGTADDHGAVHGDRHSRRSRDLGILHRARRHLLRARGRGAGAFDSRSRPGRDHRSDRRDAASRNGSARRGDRRRPDRDDRDRRQGPRRAGREHSRRRRRQSRGVLCRPGADHRRVDAAQASRGRRGLRRFDQPVRRARHPGRSDRTRHQLWTHHRRDRERGTVSRAGPAPRRSARGVSRLFFLRRGDRDIPAHRRHPRHDLGDHRRRRLRRRGRHAPGGAGRHRTRGAQRRHRQGREAPREPRPDRHDRARQDRDADLRRAPGDGDPSSRRGARRRSCCGLRPRPSCARSIRSPRRSSRKRAPAGSRYRSPTASTTASGAASRPSSATTVS